MMKIRYYIALWISKLCIILLRTFRFAATNFPGTVALKICPTFLKYADRPAKIIAVTGTNGKTTVSNMVLDMLLAEGYKVLNNRLGSNINTGIASSLIYGMSFFGKNKNDIGVLEIDERSALRIYPYIKPEIILVTNLSRDSIMRNAHPQYIADILTKHIPRNSKLILNADDLISSSISPENERVYFGIEKMQSDIKKSINLIVDSQICPKCNNLLEYEYLRYNHIGRAYCSSCTFEAPKYDCAGFNVDIEDMTMMIRDEEGVGKYKLLNDSVFNIYNVLSVVVLFRVMGYDHDKIKELFNKIDIVASRFKEQRIKDKTLYKMLAKEKNAFATTRVFDYISQMPGKKEIILMNSCQDDMRHWSENTCWLYDCDFEFLNDDNIENIVICGPRRYDHKLRLLLAGIDESRISLCETEEMSPEKLKLFKEDNIYVLYGTDSIGLGNKIADMVRNRILTEV